MLTLGSLCSGAGMLDRAVEQLFGATTVWHAEKDAAAAQVLAHRWPGVPNHGDITNPDGGRYGVPRRRLSAPRRQRQAAKRHARRVQGWKALARRVDVFGMGIPCQPFSSSGKRGGSADERHLWPIGALPAVEALMPPVIVFENVPNLLRIERGEVFGRILADLDRLGYTTAWTVVGACKVGACHHRHRLFVLAVRDGSSVVVPSAEPFGERHDDEWLPPQLTLFGEVASVRFPASGLARAGVGWSLPVQTCGADEVVLPTPRASDTGTAGRRASEGWRPPLSQVLLPLVASDARGVSMMPTRPSARRAVHVSAAGDDGRQRG
ncbi:DNA cytosine methyltransferase, partial [Micromonospora sp. NPDC049730]|uniref:DNA cytosine methyltransferase n=1 Tax=Micromonospora sp. NPDC049730 TaxID=3154836 RepID=UPI00340FB2D3